MFHKDAMSTKAASAYSRGVVVSRPVPGELFLLGISAGLLWEARNRAYTPARARAGLRSFRCAGAWQ